MHNLATILITFFNNAIKVTFDLSFGQANKARVIFGNNSQFNILRLKINRKNSG
jgi:hypothetical protein